MMNRSSSLSLRSAGLSALTMLAAISLVLGGCIDDSQIGGEGGSGGGTTSGTQGTTSTGTQGPTSTGTQGTTSTGAANCTSFPDEVSLGTATFTVKNNRAVSIYIPETICGGPFYVAASPGGEVLSVDFAPRGGTCATVGPKQLPPDCLDSSAIEIKPGGTAELLWNGLVYEQPTLPSGCPAWDPLGPTCVQAQAPKTGTMEAIVYLFESATCDAQGCTNGMGQFPVKKAFTYPADTQVQLDVN
jgi:hypothetical protein